MNVYNTYLQKQSSLVTLLAEQVSDSTHNRWSLAQKYGALNHALRNLGNRLRSPYLYTLPSYSSTALDYSLPAYVQGPFVLQHTDASESAWVDYFTYRTYPTSTGGISLRFEYAPPNSAARIIFWGVNSQVPTTVPTLSAELAADGTSAVVTPACDIGRSGFVKIGSEWIQYAGITESTSTITLLNLIRAVGGTTAAIHAAAASVEWGVAAYNMTVYNQILAEAQAYLHQLYLVKASEQERDKHMTMLRYSKQVAEEMMPAVLSPIPIQMRVTDRTIGGNARRSSSTQCVYGEI